jgi:hypothetical protein
MIPPLQRMYSKGRIIVDVWQTETMLFYVELCQHMTLFCRLEKPSRRLYGVFSSTQTLALKTSELELRVGIVLHYCSTLKIALSRLACSKSERASGIWRACRDANLAPLIAG